MHSTILASSRLDVSHFLHHVHQIAHAPELLQQARVDSFAHLLHHLLWVSIELLQVCLPIHIHLSELLHHYLELFIFLEQLKYLLWMRARAFSDTEQPVLCECGLLGAVEFILCH